MVRLKPMHGQSLLKVIASKEINKNIFLAVYDTDDQNDYMSTGSMSI